MISKRETFIASALAVALVGGGFAVRPGLAEIDGPGGWACE